MASDHSAASAAGSPHVAVSVHGPGATIEDAIKAGVATKDLLDAIGQSMGLEVGWQVQSVQFQCDGCGLRRPDRPGPDEGWTYRDGDDLCPDCTAQEAATDE